MTRGDTSIPIRRALVLGAGGHAAIAWETGLIAGLADVGVDVRIADRFIGTSAGAIVSAQITTQVPLDELFDQQADPRRQLRESAPAADFSQWRGDLLRARSAAADPTVFLRYVGSLTAQVPAPQRRASIEARLPCHGWPARDVRIVAVDADSGQRHMFERAGGAPLVDAVLASSAAAGIWPAVEIGNRRYIDGGFFSLENADLASGAERVLIVALPARAPALCVQSLEEALLALQRTGARVEVAHPDEATIAAFASVGGNLLDPAVREPAALAGRSQGRLLADRIATFWR
jgi:NTE family protein